MEDELKEKKYISNESCKYEIKYEKGKKKWEWNENILVKISG